MLQQLCRGRTVACLIVLCVGCGEVDKSGGGSKKRDKLAVPAALSGNSHEQQAIESIDWNKKAADILTKIADERSADANAGALKGVIRDKEQMEDRYRDVKFWELSKETKDSVQNKYGIQLKESSAQYVEAANRYNSYGTKSKLTVYLKERHGIDVLRMKLVEKKS